MRSSPSRAARHRYNTAILVDPGGRTVGKYRKIHLPGHADHRQGAVPAPRKALFEVGNRGFPVWRFGRVVGMMICNDRRWPESYRVMGLQGAEIVALGYNTPSRTSTTGALAFAHVPPGSRSRQGLTRTRPGWSRRRKAEPKTGTADRGPGIVAPTGEIAAQAVSDDDELVTFSFDLDLCTYYKTTVFAFEQHRRIEHYGLITERTGALPPPEE